MGDLLGTDLGINMPKVDLTGFLSSSWIYVGVIVIIGLILIIIVAIILFLMTYKRKVIIFENVSGLGYQPVKKSRARLVKLGVGGEEVMKTLSGGIYLSAYGRKMGKNTYWYAKGSDGYLYNIVLGDLDKKMGMLDIEPVDRDVRMFHVALDRLSHQTYGKQSFLEKHAVHLMLFVFLIAMVVAAWFLIGKIGDATAPLAQSNQLAEERDKVTMDILNRLDSVLRSMGKIPEEIVINDNRSSGLIPAT